MFDRTAVFDSIYHTSFTDPDISAADSLRLCTGQIDLIGFDGFSHNALSIRRISGKCNTKQRENFRLFHGHPASADTADPNTSFPKPG